MDEKKQRNLARLVKHGGFQFNDTFFPYTSGEIGPYYVQSAVVLKDGGDFAGAINDMSNFMLQETNMVTPTIISGGESRDWCFSFPLAERFGAAHAMLYKNGKFIGPELKDEYVTHVADLSNEGSSPRDLWVPAIRQRGGVIEDIFFYVDRMEDGPKVMKELGLNSRALVPLDAEAWDYLMGNDVIDETVYKNLRERGTSKEQRDAWALKMLRSKPGIQRMAEIAKTTPEKAQKIINHEAYAEVKPIYTGDDFKRLVEAA